MDWHSPGIEAACYSIERVIGGKVDKNIIRVVKTRSERKQPQATETGALNDAATLMQIYEN